MKPGRPKNTEPHPDPGELRRLRQGFLDGLSVSALAGRFNLSPRKVRLRTADIQRPTVKLKQCAPIVPRGL